MTLWLLESTQNPSFILGLGPQSMTPPLLPPFGTLTLFKPAYLSISQYWEGGGGILGLGGVRVPILFGKGFMKFGCLEPSKKCSASL